MTKLSASRAARRRTMPVFKPEPPFDMFQRGALTPITDEMVEQTMAQFPGASREVILAQLQAVAEDDIWINSRYQVNLKDCPVATGWPPMIHMSIKRIDKERVGPEKYRDFMAIKDRLIGPENEAVEIYPARSREYDTANQYHLYVIKEPSVRFPIGYDWGQRVATEQGEVGGAKQHPFDEPQHRVDL